MNWEPITVKDKKIIEIQIHRKPRNLYGVASRCWNHCPQVLINYPLPQSEQDAFFFPTVFWLTCPEAIRRINQIEDTGLVNRLHSLIKENNALIQGMKDAHLEYIYIRRSLLGPDEMLRLKAEEKELAGSLETMGIGGMSDFKGVKCLHMHYAHYLVTGNNPIGTLINDLLKFNHCQWQCNGCKQKTECRPEKEQAGIAGVAELADAADLKSAEPKGSCRFETGPRHQPLTAGYPFIEN